MKKILNSGWSKEELKFFRSLTTPFKIQRFLDSIPYSEESKYRCPKAVIRDKKAHCYDGAVFAAYALRRIGFTPIIIDMMAYRDDDHIIAIYKIGKYFGAIAKSNFVGLRFREPIYRDIRELVVSYFDSYYNMDKQKGLRGYISPLDLSGFDKYNWWTEDIGMIKIEEQLNKMKVNNLFTPKMIKKFSSVDDRTFEAGLVGANMAGIYYPGKKK